MSATKPDTAGRAEGDRMSAGKRLRAACVLAWLVVVEQDTAIGFLCEIVTVACLGALLLGLLSGVLS